MSDSEWLHRLPLYRRMYANRVLAQVKKFGRTFQHFRDFELCDKSIDLRFRAKSGEKVKALLPEAFALLREACNRVLGMKHFDVQLLAGTHLATKCVVEMATGEGKTLTALLPLFLHALAGKGSHLATANDYLAFRDGQTAHPVFESLGLTLGVIQKESTDVDRWKAYHCDVTYGTCAEFGFDFLRDRMKRRLTSALGKPSNPITEITNVDEHTPVKRKLHFILVDEADSVMIDDASTPLIIGANASKQKEKTLRLYRWAAEYAATAKEKIDFQHIEHLGKIELTERGRTWVRQIAQQSSMSGIATVDMYEYMERAIKVERDYLRDRNFVVNNGEVTIVDGNTGRLATGRHWQDGIHQAIQARERLEITVPTSSAAQLTIQSLILSYPLRAGMTGTAWSSRREFRKVYKMDVVKIRTRLPSKRKCYPAVHCSSEQEKMIAIRDEVVTLIKLGRPVLIGSRSVKKSEMLSAIFNEAKISHAVLNARHEGQEAEIVKHAGETGRVTISTSLAGRGTDIKLEEEVCKRGGLHVIIAELNDSARIDRQLIGRCARQGDPGSYRFFLSPSDDVLDAKNRTVLWNNLNNIIPYAKFWIFLGAQSQITGKNLRSRLAMLHHEKKRLRDLKQAGLDPVLDVVG